MLGILAVVMAFAAVQGASILQGPPAVAVMKGEYLTEQAATPPKAIQPPSTPGVEGMAAFLLGPLAIAVLCYLFVRRTV